MVDAAIAGALALFPLLPAGPSYLNRDWPWALEVWFLLTAALALVYLLVARDERARRRAGSGVRLVRRAYVLWLIPVAAATVIGVVERNPIDPVLLRVEAGGLAARLLRPMDQAADPLYPVRAGLTCLEGAVMFWLLTGVLGRTHRPGRRIRAAVAGLLTGLTVVGLIAVWQYLTRINLHEYWARANPGLTRAHATLDDPNALASYLVLGTGLAVGVAWAASGHLRHRGPAIAGLVAVVALLATVSRAGWAALLMATLVCTAALPQAITADWPRGRRLRQAARGGVLVLIAAVGTWAAAAAVLPKREVRRAPTTPWEAVLQTVDPREPLDAVLKRRHILWQAGIELAAAHPVSGAGLGQFPRYLATYPGSDGPENAHNYFLQVLGEMGVVGLAALIVLLAAMALAVWLPNGQRSRRQARLTIGLSVGLLAFVLTWLTGHPLLNVSNQLWLAAVVAVGLAALEPRGRVAPPSTFGATRGHVRTVLLHPASVAVVAVVTVVAAVPRLLAAARADDPAVSRAAGVYGWETAPSSDDAPPDPRFRWTRGRGALREPVRGSVLTLPLYLARPDVPPQPITVQVTIDGVSADLVMLTKNGWHVLSYDLVAVLGNDRWRSLRTVTLEFTVNPPVVPARVGPSDDRRELGVGLGEVRWSGISGGA